MWQEREETRDPDIDILECKGCGVENTGEGKKQRIGKRQME